MLVFELLCQRDELGDNSCSVPSVVLVAQHHVGEHVRKRPPGHEISFSDSLDLVGK